jgi:hypothetical protein
MNTSRHRPCFSLVVLSFLFGLFHGAAASAASLANAFSGNTYVLELEGKPVATLRSFTGGAMTGDVAVHNLGPACCISKKYLASVHAEDLVMEIAGDLGGSLVSWIQQSLDKGDIRRDGSVVILDQNFRAVRRIAFFGALVTEINLPAFDAASTSPFSLALKITPERSQLMKGGGQSYSRLLGSKQKAWLTRNFRLDIAGIDTARVSAIDAITIKRKIEKSEVGAFREPGVEAGSFEISPLNLTVSERGAEGFEAWYQDFVMNGNNGDDQEREGTLTLLTPDLQTSLLTLSLRHLGIYRFAYDSGASTSGASVRAGIYMEGVSMAGGTP